MGGLTGDAEEDGSISALETKVRRWEERFKDTANPSDPPRHRYVSATFQTPVRFADASLRRVVAAALSAERRVTAIQQEIQVKTAALELQMDAFKAYLRGERSQSSKSETSPVVLSEDATSIGGDIVAASALSSRSRVPRRQASAPSMPQPLAAVSPDKRAQVDNEEVAEAPFSARRAQTPRGKRESKAPLPKPVRSVAPQLRRKLRHDRLDKTAKKARPKGAVNLDALVSRLYHIRATPKPASPSHSDAGQEHRVVGASEVEKMVERQALWDEKRKRRAELERHRKEEVALAKLRSTPEVQQSQESWTRAKAANARSRMILLQKEQEAESLRRLREGLRERQFLSGRERKILVEVLGPKQAKQFVLGAHTVKRRPSKRKSVRKKAKTKVKATENNEDAPETESKAEAKTETSQCEPATRQERAAPEVGDDVEDEQREWALLKDIYTLADIEKTGPPGGAQKPKPRRKDEPRRESTRRRRGTSPARASKARNERQRIPRRHSDSVVLQKDKKVGHVTPALLDLVDDSQSYNGEVDFQDPPDKIVRARAPGHASLENLDEVLKDSTISSSNKRVSFAGRSSMRRTNIEGFDVGETNEIFVNATANETISAAVSLDSQIFEPNPKQLSQDSLGIGDWEQVLRGVRDSSEASLQRDGFLRSQDYEAALSNQTRKEIQSLGLEGGIGVPLDISRTTTSLTRESEPGVGIGKDQNPQSSALPIDGIREDVCAAQSGAVAANQALRTDVRGYRFAGSVDRNAAVVRPIHPWEAARKGKFFNDDTAGEHCGLFRVHRPSVVQPSTILRSKDGNVSGITLLTGEARQEFQGGGKLRKPMRVPLTIIFDLTVFDERAAEAWWTENMNRFVLLSTREGSS